MLSSLLDHSGVDWAAEHFTKARKGDVVHDAVDDSGGEVDGRIGSDLQLTQDDCRPLPDGISRNSIKFKTQNLRQMRSDRNLSHRSWHGITVFYMMVQSKIRGSQKYVQGEKQRFAAYRKQLCIKAAQRQIS